MQFELPTASSLGSKNCDSTNFVYDRRSRKAQLPAVKWPQLRDFRIS